MNAKQLLTLLRQQKIIANDRQVEFLLHEVERSNKTPEEVVIGCGLITEVKLTALLEKNSTPAAVAEQPQPNPVIRDQNEYPEPTQPDMVIWNKDEDAEPTRPDVMVWEKDENKENHSNKSRTIVYYLAKGDEILVSDGGRYSFTKPSALTPEAELTFGCEKDAFAEFVEPYIQMGGIIHARRLPELVAMGGIFAQAAKEIGT